LVDFLPKQSCPQTRNESKWQILKIVVKNSGDRRIMN
jgi:hypothetical protein